MPKRESAEQRAKRLRRELMDVWLPGYMHADFNRYLSRLLRAEREAAAERAMDATDGSYDPVLWRSRLRAAIQREKR